MVVDGSAPLLSDNERSARGLVKGVCYWCGTSPALPDQLVVVNGNPVFHTVGLILVRPCCHQRVSTEYFGTVCDYLCDGWERAELLCRLYNAHVGLPFMPPSNRPAKKRITQIGELKRIGKVGG